MITVTRAGLLATVQDLGRTGYAHLGVGRAGALDPVSLIRANRLVGNPDDAAGIETTLTGVALIADIATPVAVCGAPAPITVDGQPAPFDAAFTLPAGATLNIGSASTGVRSYLAVAGGVANPPVLGSRSTDTLSGLGPPPLRVATTLPIGHDVRAVSETDPAGRTRVPPTDSVLELRLRLGPRHDWLSLAARDALTEAEFALSVKSNRVGARLNGPTLQRAVTDELPSEGIVLGAVQLPPDGQPLIFLADHPTTGGYPVIGVVEPDDLGAVAQARPGTAIRFVVWI